MFEEWLAPDAWVSAIVGTAAPEDHAPASPSLEPMGPIGPEPPSGDPFLGMYDGPPPLELCKDGAFGVPNGVGAATGVEHWWLKQGGYETGMSGDPSTWDPTDTMWSDHAGRSEGANCAPVADIYPERADVDLDCIRDMTAAGNPTTIGTYGVDGTCQAAVTDVLAYCDPTAWANVLAEDDI
jgi:hypothetical protein